MPADIEPVNSWHSAVHYNKVGPRGSFFKSDLAAFKKLLKAIPGNSGMAFELQKELFSINDLVIETVQDIIQTNIRHE